MPNTIKIKKGLKINLKGEAVKKTVNAGLSDFYAIKPSDFETLIPKLAVQVGDKVKAGTALFYYKGNHDIRFTSPVSGIVSEINRGERRKILEVIVKPDSAIEYEAFTKADPKNLKREEIIKELLLAGIWPSIIQRPYGVIANPTSQPKAIFISAFNSAPLSADYDYTLLEEFENLKTGIEALSKLTNGKIHIGINAESKSQIYDKLPFVEVTRYYGPHPAGNVGVHINKINPINKGEIVWTIKPSDVVIIGKLFKEGKYKPEKVISLAGGEVLNPQYYNVLSGAQITPLVKKNVSDNTLRYISGDVLTGTKIESNSYLGYYDTGITVIKEGNEPELFGWAMPGLNKFSATRTFFSFLTPKKQFNLTSNMQGGERAFVVTNELDKVMPMDILPLQLLKAIVVNDIDLMEQLGIYEVIEEDFALCEFVNCSKIEIQRLLRQGLNAIRKEFL